MPVALHQVVGGMHMQVAAAASDLVQVLPPGVEVIKRQEDPFVGQVVQVPL